MSNLHQHLLSPGRIGSMTLRNRIFMTAMGSNLADEDGVCGARSLAYYAERAKGGTALLTMGSVSVMYPEGTVNLRHVAIADERHVPGVRAIADAVHSYGGKLALQLHHAGQVAGNDVAAGRPVWVPSLPVPHPGDMGEGFLEEELKQFVRSYSAEPIYNVMSHADIAFLANKFAEAADRARRAGVDGVEIHAGHGYVISSFISPTTNRRTDEYGGSVENRSRFLVAVIKAVRAAVGPDYPVWCKIDTQEFLTNGVTIEDAKVTARMAEAAGADAITASAYHAPNSGVGQSSSHTPMKPGNLIPNASAIKAAVGIPVITAGRIEFDVADKHIGDGNFDFVAMGRKLLADPHLARKLTEGKPEDVRPCIYCFTCISEIYFSRHVRCAVNPETGFERERALKPAEVKKRVVVVGGGPSGMESARRLALKGHAVTLLEQSDRLGGTVQFAAIAYEPNERILNWLKRQVGELNIDVRLKTRATVELLRSLDPDEVIVGTGAIRTMPPIPGADRANVFSGDEMRAMVLGEDLPSLKHKISWTTRLAAKAGSVTGATRSPTVVREATRAWMPFGDRIVIIGGELVGLELAEFLAERGRKVTVVDDISRFGKGLPVVRRWRLLWDLTEHGVALAASATDIRIEDGAVRYTDSDGSPRTAAADQVIVAKGAIGNLTLADALKAAGFKVQVVGDCQGVGYIDGAMNDADRVTQDM